MSRPYVWDARVKAYRVRDRFGGTVYRSTRVAAGMTATAARSGHNLTGPALSIAVRGHAARAASVGPIRQQVPRYGISRHGRERLAQLREGRATNINHKGENS